MPTFDFVIQRKYTVWEEEYHSIEAESQEEANELMTKSLSDFTYDTFLECELMYDTMDSMSLEENDGDSTIELYDDDHNLLWSNEDKSLAPSNKIEQMQHYIDTTQGLWCTDRPDLVKDPSGVLFELKYEI